MLYNFISQFVDQYSFLNVFKYLTFRTGLAMFTSMIVVLIVGTPFIKFFSARQILDPIREDGPSEHIIKKIGTKICLAEKNLINGVPTNKTIIIEVNIANPVLKVRYLNTLKKLY